MKKTIKLLFPNFVIFLLLCTTMLYSAFDGNYAFQLESATQAGMTSISNPKKGMMVYNTTDNKIYYYDSTAWVVANSSIYSSDEELSSNREVNMSAHTLSFINGTVSVGSNATLQVKKALSLEGVFYDKDGDAGEEGQVLVSTVTGTKWITPDFNPIPYISNHAINVPILTTKTVTLTGLNFISTSIVTIPEFDGSINSTTVISPSEIQLNITTGTVNTFDFVVSNSGVLNTEWTGNGAGVLKVSNNNGQAQSTAGLTCKAILNDGYSSGDGTYWINPDGADTSNAFQVYCDMTTDGGGWTRLEYAADLTHEAQFSGGDSNKWLTTNFALTLTDTQINNIRAVSTEGKQRYHGTCQGVIHHLYQTSNYAYAFGFRFHTGDETVHNQQTYSSTNIIVSNDGCKTNDGTLRSTDFDIVDIRVPVINVHSRDNSSTEEFGSPLTNNPAWLR